MEVEFLSHMRYNLLVSKEDWEKWLAKLAKIRDYLERAMLPTTSPLVIPSPGHRGFVSPIPSPTENLQRTLDVHQAQAPNLQTFAQGVGPYAQSQGQTQWPAAQYPHGQGAVSPLATKLDLYNDYGKRLRPEEDITEPAAKRISRPRQQQHPILSSQPPLSQGHSVAAPVPEPLRLPAPHLTLNTAPHPQPAPQPPSIAGGAATSYAPAQSSVLSLPPLVPGTRAMATVYPQGYPPQLALPGNGNSSTPTTLSIGSSVPPPLSTPTTYSSTNPFGTPTKRHSPTSALTPNTLSPNPPPLTEHFPPLGGVHTPISHSPSIYLQQRNSPYKPVRNFNTLLYPPPSASLEQYHLSGNAMTPSQMHYQPLGRRHEFRTGIVPEFQSVPYGGAVRQGLALTPVHAVQVQNLHFPPQPRHPVYPAEHGR